MAHKQVSTEKVKWKLGSKCDLFDRDQFKWIQVEVIGVFEDGGSQWVKVRNDQIVRDVRSIDPDLRHRTPIQAEDMKKLQHAAVQLPNIAPILNRILPSSSGKGLNSYSDSLVEIQMFSVV